MYKTLHWKYVYCDETWCFYCRCCCCVHRQEKKSLNRLLLAFHLGFFMCVGFVECLIQRVVTGNSATMQRYTVVCTSHALVQQITPTVSNNFNCTTWHLLSSIRRSWRLNFHFISTQFIHLLKWNIRMLTFAIKSRTTRSGCDTIKLVALQTAATSSWILYRIGFHQSHSK